MATAEEMAAYTARLQGHTSAQNKPVTEIAIFKLNPEFVTDHAAAASEFEAQMHAHTSPLREAPHAKGIRRTAWGFSATDPATMVWLLDYDKIQDHWTFWQTPGFPPVMDAISKLFVPGRPLVRHYDFGEAGMLPQDTQWVRIYVWDDNGKNKGPEAAKAKAQADPEHMRLAHAVDVDEMSWCCLLMGYDSEDAAKSEITEEEFAGEDHIVNLQFK